MSARRSKIEGVKRVLEFNWPIYALALAVISATCLTARSKSPVARSLSTFIGFSTALQTLASLAASFLIYDFSNLHRWQWLRKYSPAEAKTVLNIHSGYDETAGELANCFAEAEYRVIDLYAVLNRREPSIERARRLYPALTKPICETLADWPLQEASLDLIVLPFAAHELRSRAERVALFVQIAKMLRPSSGRAILVEHLRNSANALAYGPGVFHFFSRDEWLRCISLAGLTVVKEDRLTPFIGVIVICRP